MSDDSKVPSRQLDRSTAQPFDTSTESIAGLFDRHCALLSLALVAFIATACGVGWIITAAYRPAPYYFMPGPLGRVPRSNARLQFDRLTVRRIDSPQLDRSTVRPSADRLTAKPADTQFDRSTVRPLNSPYRTRALSGLNTPEEQAWGKRNGITAPLEFLHNLANVFPRELYKQHPEFFPLIAGKRLDPPAGPIFWQPDLGREDVARYAADQARRYFAEHPNADTFSLGVNDGLNFGESPETVALLRDRFRSRTVQQSNRRSASAPQFDRSTVRPLDGPQSARSTVRQFDRSTGSQTVRPFDRSTARPSADRPPLRPFDRSTVQPYFRNRPDFSPLVFTFMNRAAADLARTYPDKYLGCLAYYWCENTPPFAVDPHVLPFLTADRTQSYDPAFVREEFALQSRWAAALRAGWTVEQSNSPTAALATSGAVERSSGLAASAVPLDSSTVRPAEGPRSTVKPFDSATVRPLDGAANAADRFQLSTFNSQLAEPGVKPRLGLYDYLYGFGFLIPRVPIHAIAEHIRHAHAVGFTDYFAELDPNWGLDGPKPWVVAQLLQHPDADVDRLLDTYYTAYFQNAAGPMRQFFSRCEEQWMHQPGPSYWLKHYRNGSQATLFPSDVCAELRNLLTRAAAQANSELVRQRVTFVSDAFGITERLVAMCEARNELTTRILRHQLAGIEGERLLADYHEKRRSFFRYAHDLTERCPLAVSPINYDDWLRDDPTFAARSELGSSRSRTGSDLQFDRSTVRPSEAPFASSTVRQLDSAATAADPQFDCSTVRPARSGARELLENGDLAGPLVPGRRIAGLQFGIDLPKPWQSRVEPTELGSAELVDSGAVEQSSRRPASNLQIDRSTGRPLDRTVADRPTVRPRTRSRVLRLSGQESAIVFTWAPAQPGHTYAAAASTRAQVGPSDVVELVVGWLDAKNQRIGKPIGFRLPEGAWSNWVRLVQGGKAPPGATWVGIQLVVQHQVGSDWAEVRDFSLREIAD